MTLLKGNVRGSRRFFVCIFLLNADFHQNFALGSFLCASKVSVNRAENNSQEDFT